jgi:hypothetical protein
MQQLWGPHSCVRLTRWVVPGGLVSSACVCLQLTSFSITWNGEGDATAGTRQFASDIEFHTDVDEHGVELVSSPSELPRSDHNSSVF